MELFFVYIGTGSSGGLMILQHEWRLRGLMKMTRAQLYRRIDQAEPGELAKLEKQIAACPWRQGYHIQPVTGLLNDPNGFSYYEGYYHLFINGFLSVQNTG